MLVQEPVQAAIWDALHHYAYGDAIFLAERLYAEVASNEALHLLATCYYRGGHPTQAYMLLQKRSCPTPQCKFLMAKCCLETKKYAEAERMLAGNVLTKTKTFEEIEAEFGAMSCHVFSVLGQLYSKTDRVQKASECYKKSLKLNPLLWKSYEALCQLGMKVDPNQVFNIPSLNVPTGLAAPTLPTHPSPQSQPQALGQPQVVTPSPGENAAFISVPAPLTITTALDTSPKSTTPLGICSDHTPENHMQSGQADDLMRAPLRSRRTKPESVMERPVRVFVWSSPSFGVLNVENPGTVETSSPPLPFISPNPTPILPEDLVLDTKAPGKKAVTRRKQATKPPVFSLSGNSNTRDVSNQQAGNPPSVRRSSRLFGNSSSVKENNKSQGKTRFTSPKGVGRKSKSRTSKSQQELNEINKSEAGAGTKMAPNIEQPTAAHIFLMQQQSLGGLLKLLLVIGKAYGALAQYDCRRAVQLFGELPEHQYNTAWVLTQIGRAYFEQGDFQKAASMFSEVRRLEPYQLLGMDVYSTALWHLQREVELSALAHDLASLDKTCPQTWCATGNCFSSQKEHDVAIKFFRRAIQVDPDYAYAYTLLAHEYVLIEELDKALASFRNALRVDSRHYNAWYGIGMIYYKQEKFNLAEVHFRRALSINPQSSALICHVGVAQHAQKKTETALVTLSKAIALEPRNPLCKFHKASILLACDRHKEALEELEELKQIIPTESLVYFLMGKVHKKLGNTHLALMNFSWAMDLDPKGVNNQIKEAIDKRYATEEDDALSRLTETMPEASGEMGEERQSLQALAPEEVDPDLQAIESDESL
ncbi:cell division cycle protein 27 homolog isoform X2 [Pomacea canaliculata]|uniref:cell division cycle protein 27 homolog isoform X2 n=1 Tax=Pomacea canaliculata TaxID=400727 RepID=UPI000D731AEE|nr:cell division cycle protein 27 homolog isoform X2 [Pomacea canaliculata]